MKLFSRFATAAVLLTVAATVSAQQLSSIVVLLKNFKLHDFDASIMATLGVDTGSILYWREMGSMDMDQKRLTEGYEKVGCHPFYYMKGTTVAESGFNCRSFYCVGYSKGPKQCRDINGKPYAGVAIINERITGVQTPAKQFYFSEFPDDMRTQKMDERIARLAAIQCRPYYLVEYTDTAVAEGYECDEIGQYPYYSAENDCLYDWRTDSTGYECEVSIRPDEYDIRLEALRVMGNLDGSSKSSKSSRSRSSVSSVASVSSASSMSGVTVSSFKDLPATHAAFDAVVALQAKGVISGYPDGTFRPARTVNRAEWLKMLIAGFKSDALQEEGACFPDVSRQWFATFVCAAKRLSWVAGYADGKFRPEATVNRAEAIKMIVEAQGQKPMGIENPDVLPRDVKLDAWYASYVSVAISRGILAPNEPFYPGEALTRADAALWIEAGLGYSL